MINITVRGERRGFLACVYNPNKSFKFHFCFYFYENISGLQTLKTSAFTSCYIRSWKTASCFASEAEWSIYNADFFPRLLCCESLFSVKPLPAQKEVIRDGGWILLSGLTLRWEDRKFGWRHRWSEMEVTAGISTDDLIVWRDNSLDLKHLPDLPTFPRKAQTFGLNRSPVIIIPRLEC